MKGIKEQDAYGFDSILLRCRHNFQTAWDVQAGL